MSAELDITITPTHQRCAATLAQGFVELVGTEAALRQLERTRLDAAVAE
ncbi:hypothetical protein [Mycolicibacterium sarraceniae]|nr:hypothetical protein [Mycolicibacterium sarraceniae]